MTLGFYYKNNFDLKNLFENTDYFNEMFDTTNLDIDQL